MVFFVGGVLLALGCFVGLCWGSGEVVMGGVVWCVDVCVCVCVKGRACLGGGGAVCTGRRLAASLTKPVKTAPLPPRKHPLPRWLLVCVARRGGAVSRLRMSSGAGAPTSRCTQTRGRERPTPRKSTKTNELPPGAGPATIKARPHTQPLPAPQQPSSSTPQKNT